MSFGTKMEIIQIIGHYESMRKDKKAGKLIVFVAVALLFILSGNMSAQKFHPEVFTNELIIKLISGKDGLEDKNGKTFVLTELKQFTDPGVYEEGLKLESWILERDTWRINETNTAMENKFESIEEKLALEAWMMQAFKLEDKILEEELELEEWMLWDPSWFTPN